ncbi:MAG: SDR family oxidoreductase, partial [Acidobacteria bacterium]|nr:SDR family oxidoreductase [Acidobacteriota bacterium]
MISASLSGKRIAITGSTGFLGTALVERLLRCVPDCELVLIVRPGRRGARRRVERDILRNDAFDRLRSELGDEFDEQLGDRIHAIAGDVGEEGVGLDPAGRALLASCDIVIHSAAVVSFDSPLDRAVEVNLLGPVRVARTLNDLGVSPHLVAVSTCYVAGSRRGNAPELPIADSPFFVGVDWTQEVDAARRARHESEDRSRRPEQLDEFRALARRELGAAGTPALADKTETLRRRWVDDTMAEAGRSRARSLGFPDSYAYTKALGEGALLSEAGDLPVSIVRPSIIESALVEPSPGWIRGFRMAEPVILSYARGLLSEFPGVPEGVVDVIPVDHVVAAICAVAARGPLVDDRSGGADIVQVASGSVNPLRYGHLVDLAQEWFSKNPLYDERGQPIGVPEWRFPGRGRVQRQLTQGKAIVSYSEKVLHFLPLRGRQTELSIKLEDSKEQLERASGYVELYGAYAECEAIYGIDRLLELWESLDDDDRNEFAFDPRVIDWRRYTHDNHLPSVVKAGRARTTPNVGRSATR